MITKAEILRLAPTANSALVDAVVTNWGRAEAAGINTARRIQHFFARVAVETGGLRAVEESLTYTSAARIRRIWPSRFKTAAAAEPFVRQPKKLAIKVYGGRLGNAPGPSADGWDFRGGGMMQTTGRDNYRAMGFEDNPEALRDPETAFDTAVREWEKRGCNRLSDADDVVAVCKVINGGTHGLAEQRAYLKKAKTIWPDGRPVIVPPKPVAKKKAPPSPPADWDNSKSDDVAPAGSGEGTVLFVQEKLRELGYSEAGTPDGQLGSMTETAILAFRNDNGLGLTPTIDDELLIALPKAKPRQIATARTEATPAEVRQQVPEVQANWLSKIGAWVLGIPAAVGTVVTGLLDNLDGARGYLEPVKEFVGDVPTFVWFVLVGGVAIAIWQVSRAGEKQGIAAFQAGERR